MNLYDSVRGLCDSLDVTTAELRAALDAGSTIDFIYAVSVLETVAGAFSGISTRMLGDIIERAAYARDRAGDELIQELTKYLKEQS
jgi:hypothetical protein